MVHAYDKIYESVVSWWKSQDSFFTKVETLLVFCTILYAIQVIFGWWRRCSSNVFIKYTLWLAYTFTPVLATYTLGFISLIFDAGNIRISLPHGTGDLFRILTWILIVVTGLTGSSYSMVAYDVDDNKQYTRHLARYLLNTYSVARLFVGAPETSPLSLKRKSRKVKILYSEVILAVSLWFPPSFFNTCQSIIASSYLWKVNLHLKEYMKNEHLQSNRYNPVTLEGYNYIIFTQKIGSSKPVDTTVSQVWLSKEGILGSSGSDSIRLKEVCLSYALSRLLQRRFFGVACPEAELPKTHDLVFRGLLSNVQDNYHAAYRIIETELAFTHDHFFTPNPSFGIMIVHFAIARPLIYLVLFIGNIWFTEDKHITVGVILLVLLALELLQLYIYLSSNYLKVVLATWRFRTLRKYGIFFQILQVCNKLPQLFGCWQNKIGQHSLLKDLHNRSITSDVIGSLYWTFIGKLGMSAFPKGICNPGVKDPDRVCLTYRVKKAIALTLKSSDGRLSNGTSSLERNGQVQLSQEFLLGSHTGDVLIWHIATEYCDIAQSFETVRQDDLTASNHDVAARLSSYCAYLMAFVPELLPDDQLETMAVFHRARKEALKNLHGDASLRAKYTKLRNYGQPPLQNGNMNDGQAPQENENMNEQPPPQNGDVNHCQPPQENENMNDGLRPLPQDVNVFDKGIQLGKRLEGNPDKWRILADFWTEMILYIAPSNNVRDHIQHLANGGEFITHLWALPTHAGILERPSQNVVNVEHTTEAANQPHQDHAQGFHPEPPHTEDTQNAVNLHEIEEETNTSGRGNLPDQGNYGFHASTSIGHQSRVGIV